MTRKRYKAPDSHLIRLVITVYRRVTPLRQRDAVAGIASELVRITVGQGQVDEVPGLQTADALITTGVGIRSRVISRLNVCQLPGVSADGVGEL